MIIHAADALALPGAQLNKEELAGADKLEAEIDAFIRTKMQWQGVDFKTEEVRGNVVAEVNQRIKRAGYNTVCQRIMVQHKLNAALTQLVGFVFSIAPRDEAYRSIVAS